MSDSSKPRPITIAIMAMGGQGGGVLADWIVGMAERADYRAQTTSVPGVAQRTGATIYYVELFPEEERRKAGKDPVLALMPVPGDVDLVLAAEFMEVGRALQRGLVTPDRTTLIASSHRVYSISEKTAMADGIADPEPIRSAAEAAAKSFISFDMQELAERNGSVISAVLFGALAGSGALPFPREAFEDAIRHGGIGVELSLKAFAAAYQQAQNPDAEAPAETADAAVRAGHPDVQALLDQLHQSLPASAHANAVEGVRRLIDYQDIAYARLYLERLERCAAIETDGAAESLGVTAELARYLALWMSYEDTIRVADLKTRRKRFRRVHDEVRAEDEQIVYVTEFMHPRVEEICDTLPAGLGRAIKRSPRLCRLLGRFTHRGRHVRTATLRGFMLLYVLAGLRRWRRRTLRYADEDARIRAWLERVEQILPRDPGLALEVVRCQRLVKGYGDTHARGLGNFLTIMAVIDQNPARADLVEQVRQLREAALADDEGKQLQSVLATLEPAAGAA